jgi:uncharacterized protein involved in exopolysaccharide biosynthesis
VTHRPSTSENPFRFEDAPERSRRALPPSPRAPEPPSWADDPDALGLAPLRDYVLFVLRAPLRHKALAIASFVCVLALAIVTVRVIPHRYQVQASLLAQRSPVMGALSNPNMNREWDAPTRAARELVIRRDNLIALARSTRFLERYLENRAPAVRARDWIVERVTRKPRDLARLFDDLVDTLEERLWVTVGTEGAVTITFVWSDRELAGEIVQAALQTFLDERYASEIKTIGETVAILQGHDARVQKEVAATVERVEAKERALGIRSVRPIGAPPIRATVPDEEVTRLESLLASRRRALTDLETFRQHRLSELQAQLAHEQGVYGPRHPTLMSTRQTIESLSEPSPQIAALRAETQDLERQIARHGPPRSGASTSAPTSSPEMADVRLRLAEAVDPRLEVERRRLDDLLRQHTSLLERIDAGGVEMDTAQAAFKYRYSVIAPPSLPKKPIKAYGLLALAGGLLGGVAMALFACTAADLAAGRVLERWQLERSLGVPVLGEIPR